MTTIQTTVIYVSTLLKNILIIKKLYGVKLYILFYKLYNNFVYIIFYSLFILIIKIKNVNF